MRTRGKVYGLPGLRRASVIHLYRILFKEPQIDGGFHSKKLVHFAQDNWA